MNPKPEKSDAPSPKEKEAASRLPAILPILPLKDTVVFPEFPFPLTVGRKRSIQLVDDVILKNKLIGLVAQKDSRMDEPSGENLFGIGIVGVIRKFLKHPDGTLRLLMKGIRRIRILEYVQETPYLTARTEPIAEPTEYSVEVEAMAKNLLNQVQRMLSLMPMFPEEVGVVFLNITDPGRLADLVAANFLKTTEQRQEVLETLDLRERLVKVTRWISSEIEILELGSKIQRQVQEEMNENQREFFLRRDTACRFIQKNYRRFMKDRTGKCEALFPSAAQNSSQASPVFCQPGHLDCPIHALFKSLPAKTVYASIEIDILLYSQPPKN